MILERFVNGRARANAYLYSPDGTGASIVVDPGVGAAAKIMRRLAETGASPRGVLLTHGHPDHVWTARELSSAFEIPVWMHAADLGWLREPATGGSIPFVSLGGRLLSRVKRLWPPQLNPLEGGEQLEVGGITVQALHTPGHTAGSSCFLTGDICFTGDTVFAAGPGHTVYPGGNAGALRRSIASRVLLLPDDIRLLPGHGAGTRMSVVRPKLERFAGS